MTVKNAALLALIGTTLATVLLLWMISPAFAKVVNLWWFDSGVGIFELATGFWLVFKELRRGIAAPDRAQAGAA